MSIFKKYKIDSKEVNSESENSSPSFQRPKKNDFKYSIRVENFGQLEKFLKLKEDLIQGKIEEKDLSKKDLDGVTKLLKEEIAQNELTIKSLQSQIAKYKKNN